MYLSGYSGWIILSLLLTVIGFVVQGRVTSTFARYSKESTAAGRTGRDVANLLINQGTEQTPVQAINGTLSDHFDPTKNTVSLSKGVYDSSSVAAVAVAAHECGHVMQYRDRYGPMRLRSAIVPLVNFASGLSGPLLILGILLGGSVVATRLFYIGIALFAATLLFQIVTLPVELNASARALTSLQQGQYLTSEEMVGAQKMLRAAAMTYVAAALTSLLQLLYLLAQGSRRRD